MLKYSKKEFRRFLPFIILNIVEKSIEKVFLPVHILLVQPVHIFSFIGIVLRKCF